MRLTFCYRTPTPCKKTVLPKKKEKERKKLNVSTCAGKEKKNKNNNSKIHFLHIVNYAAHASTYSSLGSGRGYFWDPGLDQNTLYFGGSRKC